MKPKLNLVKYYLSLALAFNTAQAYAVGPASGCNQDISGNYFPCDSSSNENRVYAGIVFDLDGSDGFMPDLVLGIRSIHSKSNNDVNGGDLSARISYGKHDKGILFDSARLVYVGGQRDVMGNIGIGYSNIHESLLGTIAIQGPYSRIGTDFEFNKNKLEPYLEINSLDKPNKVQGTCLNDGRLIDGECVLPPG